MGNTLQDRKCWHPFSRQQTCWAPHKSYRKTRCLDTSTTKQVTCLWRRATGLQEKTSLIWAHGSLKTLRLFWMKGVLKHHSSEEMSRTKTPSECLSFLLSDSLKTTGSSLPLVSLGSSHRCQKAIPRVTLLVLVQSAHVYTRKNIKEKHRELSKRKIILNLHLGKAQSFVFISLLPRPIFSFFFHIHPWILFFRVMGRFWLLG